MKSGMEWSQFEYFNPLWKKRIESMVEFIEPSTQSILDLGCGPMWLKSCISSKVKYFGCDYTKRNQETIVCDLNKYEFPNIHSDIYFMSGIIEYIDDLDWLFGQTANYSNGIILSYCSRDFYNKIYFRKRKGWRNHYSTEELIGRIELHGFQLSNSSSNIKNNIILYFKKVI